MRAEREQKKEDMPLDLAVVMPVYNEQDCIAGVVESWRRELTSLGISYHILVLNDGSTDGTAARLQSFAGAPDVRVTNKANSGHGPTILMGYHRAIDLADWVFQCDSDDEMKPEHFASLWSERGRYDALFGMRLNREQNLGRRIISAVSRLTVQILFGKGVVDVNVPFRLIKAELLGQIVRQIPPDTFAPNVIIAGSIAKGRLRIYNHPIPHESRKTGTVSIVRWKLWKSAFRSLLQTLRCRPVVAAVREQVEVQS